MPEDENDVHKMCSRTPQNGRKQIHSLRETIANLFQVFRYSQQSNSLIFNGRYIFDISTHGQIKIQDLQNNNKLVASITYKGNLGWGVGFDPLIRKKEYVIDKLIESNK